MKIDDNTKNLVTVAIAIFAIAVFFVLYLVNYYAINNSDKIILPEIKYSEETRNEVENILLSEEPDSVTGVIAEIKKSSAFPIIIVLRNAKTMQNEEILLVENSLIRKIKLGDVVDGLYKEAVLNPSDIKVGDSALVNLNNNREVILMDIMDIRKELPDYAEEGAIVPLFDI